MKRKKKHEEHVDEAWLLPYSDMLTLLLALFIVMFAMAKVDDEKFQEIKSEFGTILSSHHSSSSVIGSVIDMGTTTNKKATTSAEAKAQEAATQVQLENQQLQTISTQLTQELADSGLKDQTEVKLESDGLHITLASSILFASGSADMTATTKQSLDLLATSLKKLKENKIIIAGHTDNVPEKGTGRYQSNWELSSARAITVMNYFISKDVILEKNAAIQAFADTEPKADNQTAQGRSENRRVEMIIQRTNTENE